MKQDILKEIRYGSRNSRFLIIFAGFMFFALLTPVMLKLILPAILQSQMPGLTEELLDAIVERTQTGSIRSYMGDVFEAGSIIVAFSLCGLIAQEIRDHTLIMPLCSGKRLGSMIGAKLLVFGLALIVAPLVALLITYAYSGMIFSFEIGIRPILRGGFLQGLYMVFLLSCLILWGAIIKKPIAAGFLSLGTVFGLQFAGDALSIAQYLPTGLLNEAQMLSEKPGDGLPAGILITAGLILIFAVISLLRLRKLEWTARD